MVQEEMSIRERIDKLHEINKKYHLPYIGQIGDVSAPAWYDAAPKLSAFLIKKIKKETGFEVRQLSRRTVGELKKFLDNIPDSYIVKAEEGGMFPGEGFITCSRKDKHYIFSTDVPELDEPRNI